MKFLEKLLNWKSSIVGIITALAAIFGWNHGADVGPALFLIIQGLASLWLIFGSKD